MLLILSSSFLLMLHSHAINESRVLYEDDHFYNNHSTNSNNHLNLLTNCLTWRRVKWWLQKVTFKDKMCLSFFFLLLWAKIFFLITLQKEGSKVERKRKSNHNLWWKKNQLLLFYLPDKHACLFIYFFLTTLLADLYSERVFMAKLI